MLKSLWDVITLVKSSFEDWNTTLWCDINVEQMEMDCKKFVKVFIHPLSLSLSFSLSPPFPLPTLVFVCIIN